MIIFTVKALWSFALIDAKSGINAHLQCKVELVHLGKLPLATGIQLTIRSQGRRNHPQLWVFRFQPQLTHGTQPLKRITLRITKDQSLKDSSLSSPCANLWDVLTSEVHCKDKHNKELWLFQILLRWESYTQQELGRTAKPHGCLLLMSLLSSFSVVNTYACINTWGDLGAALISSHKIEIFIRAKKCNFFPLCGKKLYWLVQLGETCTGWSGIREESVSYPDLEGLWIALMLLLRIVSLSCRCF